MRVSADKHSAIIAKAAGEDVYKRQALNSLPEIQGRRVDAHLILGKSYRQIAREEGVDKSAVRCSVKCGIERMKKYLQENF